MGAEEGAPSKGAGKEEVGQERLRIRREGAAPCTSVPEKVAAHRVPSSRGRIRQSRRGRGGIGGGAGDGLGVPTRLGGWVVASWEAL